jgi:hypothetical protein
VHQQKGELRRIRFATHLAELRSEKDLKVLLDAQGEAVAVAVAVVAAAGGVARVAAGTVFSTIVSTVFSTVTVRGGGVGAAPS